MDKHSGSIEYAYSWLEWTVDGVTLRSMYSHGGPEDRDVTMLHAGDSEDEAMRTENLLRLRGDTIPPPTFEPRFHRTRLDRILHLRGTPYAPAGTAFEDGRVGLLYCYCGDLDCGALSTRVDITAETVTWDLAFHRVQYESLINQLLDADWSRGLPTV